MRFGAAGDLANAFDVGMNARDEFLGALDGVTLGIAHCTCALGVSSTHGISAIRKYFDVDFFTSHL